MLNSSSTTAITCVSSNLLTQPYLLLISGWQMHGPALITNKIMYAILLRPSFEGHALLIATLHYVDPIYVKWLRSRWTNCHSARRRQRHPELPLFIVLKVQIRPSSS